MSKNEADREKRVRLLSRLERKIRSQQDWWTFDPEGSVEGFRGPGPIVIVGDQPSTSEWQPGHLTEYFSTEHWSRSTLAEHI
jgi:hypothetical protein